MEFDVIITNPPYHLLTAGNGNGAQTKPLYHKFVELAIRSFRVPIFLFCLFPE